MIQPPLIHPSHSDATLAKYRPLRYAICGRNKFWFTIDAEQTGLGESGMAPVKLLIRDFYGHANDDLVYNTCGIAKRYADHIMRSIIRAARQIEEELGPAGIVRDIEMIRQMSNTQIPDEDDANVLDPAFQQDLSDYYAEFNGDMVVRAERKGKHVKFIIINMLHDGSTRSVDFFPPEIVSLACYVKLLWLNEASYNAPIFTAGFVANLDDSIDFFE